MKVVQKQEVVCNECGSRDSFIYFAGPGRSRRICMVCLNEQTGIDTCVDSRQSDDPPELRHCDCGEIIPANQISELCDQCYIDAIEIIAWYENSKSDNPPEQCPDCNKPVEWCECLPDEEWEGHHDGLLAEQEYPESPPVSDDYDGCGEWPTIEELASC